MSETPELVDLSVIFPSLHIDLKYATADNITGAPIYREARCLLHTEAVTALAKSISIAQLAGLKLVVYDAYRPQQAQAVLWNACPDPQYVVDVAIGSNHSRGANATMRDRVGKGDYDIAIGNWSPDFADPYMFMNYWFESDKKGLPGNRSFYENGEVDKLLRSALATTDQVARTNDYQQAQTIVIDEAAYVYLFQKNYQLAMNKDVKGFVFNPMLEQVFNISTMSK